MAKKRTSRVTKRTSRVTNKRRYRGGGIDGEQLKAHLTNLNRVIVEILNHMPECSDLKEPGTYDELMELIDDEGAGRASGHHGWNRGHALSLHRGMIISFPEV